MILQASMPPSIKTLTGNKFNDAAFRFVEATSLDPNTVLDVLQGRLAGAVVRGFLSHQECTRIAENFWCHPDRYRRDADAPADYVGTYHYRKSLNTYLSEVERLGGRINTLFNGTKNPAAEFITSVARHVAASAITVRLAEHHGRQAGRFVMRSWAGLGQFALSPHDDEIQCRDPGQSGFEIQNAAINPLVAVNICVENGTGGNLYYWNIIPDDQSRERLGLQNSGSPYPTESLNGITYKTVTIYPGDIYFFNGKAVHAVSSLSGPEAGRATIAFLMAKLDDKTIIYWT